MNTIGGAPSLLPGQTWSALARALRLSTRELQIVVCMIENRLETDVQIAEVLGISPHTVHTHLERLFRKLDVTSRSHLILRVFSAYVREQDMDRHRAV